MKSIIFIFVAVFFISFQTTAQDSFQTPFSFVEKSKDYSECTAIFYKDKMLVNEYSPKGFCKLEQGMEGELTLATVNLTENGGTATEFISFQIAIRNPETNTLRMFSDKVYKSVDVKEILLDCKVGDNIVILTNDRKYSLTHNEIRILWGC